MRCANCNERPGFVRAHVRGNVDGERLITWEPCPDCMGSAVGHCCDGLQEQPTPQKLPASGSFDH